MFIAPLIIAAVLVIAFPRLMKLVLTLCVFGAMLFVASCIDHARADDLSTADHETLIRYAGYFSNCARGNVINHRDDLHKISMLGGNSRAVLIMSCDPIANEYLHWCETVGHDESSCYGDLRFMADDILKQNGD